jgi:site-specific DNA recombinase
MDTSALRVAIYTRISQDRTGAELGVERQLEDCQALAKANGWTVVAEYSDNDISAYGGKRRPGYAALLDAIKNRDVDVAKSGLASARGRRGSGLATPRSVST